MGNCGTREDSVVAAVHAQVQQLYMFPVSVKSTPSENPIKGMIKAPPHRSAWDETNRRHWILFDGVNNLQVTGGGIINGNGQIWWKNSCKINKYLPCKNAPTAITFYGSNNLVVENLKVKNSQQIHEQFEKCTNFRASYLSITAPENSPNTDGIHITSTQNINLDHCNIGTGDDCISIVDGAQTVKATNISCGPGHGIKYMTP
ncbi:uncharacterized protein A4U43_C01F25830 [Asparagus officinalis]|uniref:Polygalacturonase n=1 Tax=Asparagus officinalis TaxID=4686 RepID=A0A5P1FW95_ASPOF|nr:uncharacterized protein A4U43_C01F25830 [Asparagus officinalis]